MTLTPIRLLWQSAILILGWLVLIAACSAPTLTPTPEPPTPTRSPRPTFTPFLHPTDTPVPPTPVPLDTPIIQPLADTSTTAASRTPADVNPLTGLKVNDPKKLQRRPLLVRIGNDPIIRPQTGLSAADLVFEEIMDGWSMTRLTAVYLAQDPETVGPVRSARLINLELTPQFDGALAHSGASDHIRWLISQASFVDLDEFFHPAPYWYKSNTDWRGRLFTGIPRLRDYLRKNGREKAVHLDGWTFDPSPPSGRPATTIDLPYPRRSEVRWKYDPTSGTYLRWVNDEPLTDAVNGKQLAAANVLVLYAEHEKTDIVEDSLGATAIRIVLTGQGKMLLCRDGVAVEGTWQRKATGDLIQFYDAAGQPLKLKPGNSWIEIVPARDFQILTR
jgi:hypothetical protein